VKDCFNYGHVLNGVLDGDGNFSVFQNGFGEGITLQSVLIADGEGFSGDASAEEVTSIVDEEASGAVNRHVERDFELNAPARAEEVNALVGDQLRTASKDGLAGGEIENR
jgi:hypothetical protein